MKHELLTMKGRLFDDINSGLKEFDYRTGIRDIKVGDFVDFVEADELGNRLDGVCTAKVNYVLRSNEGLEHFGWIEEFTIIQFEVM